MIHPTPIDFDEDIFFQVSAWPVHTGSEVGDIGRVALGFGVGEQFKLQFLDPQLRALNIEAGSPPRELIVGQG